MLPQLDLTPDPSDTLAMEIGEVIHKVSTMSGQEIWSSIASTIIKLGLKVLAALLIYVIGAWLIRRVKKILRNVFIRRKVEPSLSSFTISFVNISLTVLLFVMVVTILGVPASTFGSPSGLPEVSQSAWP